MSASTRTDTEAETHLAAIRDQGVSISEYSRRTGIPVSRIYYWRKRESKIRSKSVEMSPEKFQRVRFPFDSQFAYAVEIGNNRIEISRGFDPVEVSHMVRILMDA